MLGRGLRIGLGEQHADVSRVRKRNPHLGAVEPIGVALAPGGGSHRACRIGTAAGLRQGEHTDLCSRNEIRHEAFGLVLGAPVIDGVRAGHGLHVHRVAELGGQPRDFFRDYGYRQEAGLAAAQFFRERRSEKPASPILLMSG